MFQYFITQARTDQYNLMCYIVAHDRLQPYYEDDVSSISDRAIPNDTTIKILEALGATFNFIGIWLKLLRDNYCARSESYINAMKQVFMQIPQNFERALTSKEKIQKLLTDIGRGWYMEKSVRELPPLKRKKLSKKSTRKAGLYSKETI